MTAEPRTSPERRAALRRRYTPEPVPTCAYCHRGPMVRIPPQPVDAARYVHWGCPHDNYGTVTSAGEPEIIALIDDADALAGALAERDDAMEAQENAWRNVNLLTERLGAERTALHEDVARLRAALSWLVREARGYLDIEADTSEEDLAAALTHAATVLHALAGPATESPHNRALDSLQALQGAKTANDAGMAQDARTARNTGG